MDAEELRTAFAEAKAQSLKLLGRKTDTVNIARHAYYDDGNLSGQSLDSPKKIHPPLTVADVEAIVEERINRHAEIWREVMGQVIAQERKRHRAEVGKLRSEHDLRIIELSKSVDKLEHANGDRAEVIELPTLPLRSSRRA